MCSTRLVLVCFYSRSITFYCLRGEDKPRVTTSENLPYKIRNTSYLLYGNYIPEPEQLRQYYSLPGPISSEIIPSRTSPRFIKTFSD